MADVWWQRGPKPADAANAQSNEGSTASGDSPQVDAESFKDPPSQTGGMDDREMFDYKKLHQERHGY